jgi:hypothetical protein
LKLDLPINLSEDLKRTFFSLLSQNPLLQSLGLHKVLLQAYRPRPPLTSFIQELTSPSLHSLAIYPLGRLSHSTDGSSYELTAVQTTSILEHVPKMPSLSSFKMVLAHNPNFALTGAFINEDDRRTLFKRVMGVVRK